MTWALDIPKVPADRFADAVDAAVAAAADVHPEDPPDAGVADLLKAAGGQIEASYLFGSASGEGQTDRSIRVLGSEEGGRWPEYLLGPAPTA